MVMDNEFAAMIRYVLQGMPVDDENLACDLIKKVGPGGNHLTEELTMSRVRGFQSSPRFIDRNMMENWVAEGSVDLKTKCDEEARRILDNHEPTPIPEDAALEIKEIIAKEERDLGIRE